MYALLGIGREDKPARFAHLAQFFLFRRTVGVLLLCRSTDGAAPMV